MNVSRGFLLPGLVCLLIGMTLGMYMGGSANHDLLPVHAHVGLAGFVPMVLFAVVYRQFPSVEGRLSQIHF
ncbi:MAG: hypothetical protein ACE5DK_07570 [Paracoccaceae bacterium]